MGIIVVAFLLRLAWALYATRRPMFLGDSYEYFFLGKQIAAGGGYLNMVNGEATAYYPVGYPSILGALFWFVEHSHLPIAPAMAAGLLNVAFGTASVVMVFVIARRAFGEDVRVALVAAAIAAVFPNLVFFVATLNLETAFIFFALASLTVLATHDWSVGPPTRNRLLLFGAVLGVSSLVRPFSLPFLVALVLAVLATGAGWRRALKALGWVVLPLVLVLVPWTVRNMRALDSPVVFSTNMGDTVCLDRSPNATGRFVWANHEGCADPALPEVERNAASIGKAVAFVREDPAREVRLMVQRGRLMMGEDHDGASDVEAGGKAPFLGARLRAVLTSGADWFFYAAVALAAFGLLGCFGRRRPGRYLVSVPLLTLLIVPLGLWGNTRFHVPALPFIAIAAAVAIVRIGDRLRRRTRIAV